jgi:hypothetical protein
MEEWWLIKERGRLWEIVRHDDPRIWDCDWKCKAGLSRRYAEKMLAVFNKGRDKSGNVIKFR